jgi:hypothetical protein
VNPVIARIDSGSARDNYMIAGLKRVRRDALRPDPSGSAPFGTPHGHGSIGVGCFQSEKAMRIPKQKLGYLAIHRNGFLFLVSGGEGMMSVGRNDR